MLANAEANIWERLVDPSWNDLEPRAAEAILRLRFRDSDIQRMNELAAKARDGQLSAAQERELDTYDRIGNMLAILQCKARMALKDRAGNGQ